MTAFCTNLRSFQVQNKKKQLDSAIESYKLEVPIENRSNTDQTQSTNENSVRNLILFGRAPFEIWKFKGNSIPGRNFYSYVCVHSCKALYCQCRYFHVASSHLQRARITVVNTRVYSVFHSHLFASICPLSIKYFSCIFKNNLFHM